MRSPEPTQPAPSFSFYPGDYLRDARYLALASQPVAFVAWHRLWLACWHSDRPGSLPDDDAILAAISGAGSAWLDIRQAVSTMFRRRGGRWIAEDQMMAFEEQKRRRVGKQKGAELTNEKRWGSVAERQTSESLEDRSRVALPLQLPVAVAVAEDKTTPPNTITRGWWKRDAFTQFWSLYANKVGKATAERSWDRIPDKSPEMLDRILAAIRVYQQTQRWLDGYRCNPVTWINQRRWEDEPTAGSNESVEDRMSRWAREEDAKDAADPSRVALREARRNGRVT